MNGLDDRNAATAERPPDFPMGYPAHVQFVVGDTGCGIPAEHLPRIFDRLYQVPGDDRSRSAGLGLGLHIAQELVRLHKGNIRVESAVGRGSTFYVTLPAPTSPRGPSNASGEVQAQNRIYENQSARSRRR